MRQTAVAWCVLEVGGESALTNVVLASLPSTLAFHGTTGEFRRPLLSLQSTSTNITVIHGTVAAVDTAKHTISLSGQ